MTHRVFLTSGHHLDPYEPHRVIANDWGLTLIWDGECGGVEKTHLPWHRVLLWTERPPVKDPA